MNCLLNTARRATAFAVSLLIRAGAVSICTVSICTVSNCMAAEPTRVWVDIKGYFTIEAKLSDVIDNSVVLIRKDGVEIQVQRDQLSERDNEYLDLYVEQKKRLENRLRNTPPEPIEFDPQPLLDLPDAAESASEGDPIQLIAPRSSIATTKLPGELTPDPAPTKFAVGEGRIEIFRVDTYDECSRPVPVKTMSESGTPSTSIVMSVSSGLRVYRKAKHELIRFDVQDQNAYVSFEHHLPLRLLDHHAPSNRALVLVGHNTLGKGGQLAIVTGLGQEDVKLSHMRSLGSAPLNASAAHLRWARWIDDEHFIAVIDNSLGLWNLISGKQLYRIEGLDSRSEPALSGGRRYVAVPYRGAVVLYSSVTGKPLGRIGVEKQVPGVSFSPIGHALAISTNRKVRIWDLPSASLSAEISGRTGLGTGTPVWVNSDLILSSNGVLMSAFRGLPIWKYDVSTAEIVSIGDRLACFRKHPTSELSTLTLPHTGADAAMSWIDSGTQQQDASKGRVVGRSRWEAGQWIDEDVRISKLPAKYR